MNPAEWLARTAQTSPDSPALLYGTYEIANYREFANRAASIGAALRGMGIGPGARVAIFMANSVEYLPIFYGVLYSGAMPVPINGKLHPKEAAWILQHSAARVVFASEPGAFDDVICIAPEGQQFAEMVATEPMDWPCEMAADDGAWLFYTSGTTGRPKGAVLTCQNLMAMSLSYLADVDDVAPGDAALYAAPMSHGAGLYNFVHVLRGARHVVPQSGGFDPAEILELAEALGDVSFFAAPTMVKRLTAHASAAGKSGQGIKTIVYGGGPMYVADIKQALDVFGPKFVQIYGQGESPMTITALSRADIADRTHPDWETRLASVGRAHSVAQVMIMGPDGGALAAGEIGEIAVAGPQRMQGYLDNEDANAKAFRGAWLLTGDLGHLDRAGYLHLHDRAKDLVISGGANIYPREVEEVLLTHSAVAEVSVVGQPDAEWGEIVVAFVVPAPGPRPDPTELDTLCTSAIARFKKPKRYEFVSALPKNNYGKVLKTELRKLLEPA